MTLIVAACGWIFCPSIVASIRSFLVGLRAELGRSFRLLQGSDALMQPFTRPASPAIIENSENLGAKIQFRILFKVSRVSRKNHPKFSSQKKNNQKIEF